MGLCTLFMSPSRIVVAPVAQGGGRSQARDVTGLSPLGFAFGQRFGKRRRVALVGRVQDLARNGLRRACSASLGRRLFDHDLRVSTPTAKRPKRDLRTRRRWRSADLERHAALGGRGLHLPARLRVVSRHHDVARKRVLRLLRRSKPRPSSPLRCPEPHAGDDGQDGLLYGSPVVRDGWHCKRGTASAALCSDLKWRGRRGSEGCAHWPRNGSRQLASAKASEPPSSAPDCKPVLRGFVRRAHRPTRSVCNRIADRNEIIHGRI